MGLQSDTIKHIFMHRLMMLGIEIDIIPLFMRDLRTSLSTYPTSDLREIGRVIKRLGWDDIELDYQTFQLAKAYFKIQNRLTEAY